MNIIDIIKASVKDSREVDQITSGLYVPVQWPASQSLMEKEGFLENCHLINDTTGYQQFGDSAYMVNLKWLNSLS